jgi:hypothetical protein
MVNTFALNPGPIISLFILSVNTNSSDFSSAATRKIRPTSLHYGQRAEKMRERSSLQERSGNRRRLYRKPTEGYCLRVVCSHIQTTSGLLD